MKMKLTVPAGAIRGLLSMAKEKNISITDRVELIGLTYDQMRDQETRFPISSYFLLLEHMIHVTSNPALALHYGAYYPCRNMSIIGLICECSATLRIAIGERIKYESLIKTSPSIIELKEEGDMARIILKHTVPAKYKRFLKYLAETGMVQIANGFLKDTVIPIKITEVSFEHAAPDYIHEYQKIFKAPLTFHSAENAIIFKRNFLDVKMKSAQPYLKKLLSGHARRIFQARKDMEEDIAGAVRQLIAENLPQGAANCNHICKHLNLSRQTLYRKLKEKGTSFRELYTEARKELALHYLKEKNATIEDVTYLLGFSEPSAFYRAFKNWTGKNPSHYFSTDSPS